MGCGTVQLNLEFESAAGTPAGAEPLAAKRKPSPSILRAAFSASSALDEADAQIPLELSHRFAELRLGLAGRAQGGGEAAVAHHLCEIVQIVQVLQRRLPPYLSFLQKKKCVGHMLSTGSSALGLCPR